MERIVHRKILAEMYGVGEGQLLSQYDRMMPQIRNDAIVTLSIGKNVNVPADTVLA